MSSKLAKENILKKIRQALQQPVPVPFLKNEPHPFIFQSPKEDNAIIFAESFLKLQGNFSFCKDEAELHKQFHQLIKEKGWTYVYCKEEKWLPLLKNNFIEPYSDLESCDVSITGCEYLIARTGTIVMSTAQQSGRTASVYAPIHICLAYTSQLVYDVGDAIQLIHLQHNKNYPSLITFASGPSRTADIEKTLVTGVHGPKEVYCFLIEG